MVFNDNVTNQGIIQECESILFDDNYGAISANTSLLQTFTRYANNAMDRITSIIFDADGRWQWDDANNTDYPIATSNLTALQKDYPFSITQLNIARIECQDQNGKYQRLLPLDINDIVISVNDFETVNGTPLFYDKLANSLFLYPTPSYSTVNDINGNPQGLKVWFQRAANYFLTSDTTKEPGFVSIFHRLVALWSSYYYASKRELPLAESLMEQIEVMEDQLQDFFLTRGKDEHRTMRAYSRRVNWR